MSILINVFIRYDNYVDAYIITWHVNCEIIIIRKRFDKDYENWDLSINRQIESNTLNAAILR